jgi:exonuclease III
MTEKITFCTLNCQGLGSNEKRKDVLNFLKQKKYSIYCIQDTHFIEKDEVYIRSQWGYECYFSSHTSNSRGVAILLNNNFEYKLNRMQQDANGNKLILDINIKGKQITLINIYGPNRDNPAFYEHIREDINYYGNDIVILLGDFNMVMNQDKDTKGYINVNNPKAKEKLLDICTEFNLVDLWRECNAEKNEYTWRTANGNKHARLDFVLLSDTFFSEIGEVHIETGYRTDHSMVVFTIKNPNSKKMKLFWKFNNSLLKDRVYVQSIKNIIENVKNQYSETRQKNDDTMNSNENAIFTINDQLFLEVLLMEIRGKTISYSSYFKKEINKTETNLNE